MSRTLIIGIGNTLRGDDGLGCRAVEELRRILAPDQAEMILCHQLTPELAESVSRAARVIFIDCCVGRPAGKIRVSRLTPGPSSYISLTHRLDPRALMHYSRELSGKWPEGWTISMTGANYDYSDSLSAVVESELPALVDLVRHAALEGPAWLERSGVYSNG